MVGAAVLIDVKNIH